MLLLGIDIGTSSLKVSVVDAAHAAINCFSSLSGNRIRVLLHWNPGWAEQSPDMWVGNMYNWPISLNYMHNEKYDSQNRSSLYWYRLPDAWPWYV